MLHIIKKTFTLAALSLLTQSALAASYYVVVPMQGKVAAAPAITAALNAATLPEGYVGQTYAYDMKQLLVVTGDASLDLAQSTWQAMNALPAGISLGTNGVLSGTPTTANESGAGFTVTASYKTANGTQVYTIVVNGVALEVTKISAGGEHTCAVTSSSAVKCWGDNYYGQLGTGTTTQSITPVAVSGLSNGVKSISAGQNHTCAVLTSGEAKCWGENSRGQLGDGTETQKTTPVTVTGLSGVASIVAGYFNTCAVTSTGAAKCWGYNSNGQLGDGTTTHRNTPVSVSGLSSGVSGISSGRNHTCAATSGGAMCWGENSRGQLGDGTTTQKTTPVAVTGLSSGLAAITAGYYASCAVTASGAAKCWGFNGYGELGDGSTTDSYVPVAVSGLSSGVSSISAGTLYACAVTTAGAAKCWGRNAGGQLGTGGTSASYVPVDVSGMSSGVASISAGPQHACAMTADGAAKCWGPNNNGQLGNGATTQSTTPVQVSDL